MVKHSVMPRTFMFAALAPLMLFFNAHATAPQKISQFPEGERLVYTRLVESFRRNQLPEVLRQRQILERNYPNSIHLDHAYYLTGMVEYQSGRLGEALKSFDIVRDRFVKSNKRPSALFGMAITYQRLNLPVQAHRAFQRIMDEYPGSPESQRAWMQLRIEAEAAKTAVRPQLKR